MKNTGIMEGWSGGIMEEMNTKRYKLQVIGYTKGEGFWGQGVGKTNEGKGTSNKDQGTRTEILKTVKSPLP
jgi:hypothetical protein